MHAELFLEKREKQMNNCSFVFSMSMRCERRKKNKKNKTVSVYSRVGDRTGQEK